MSRHSQLYCMVYSSGSGSETQTTFASAPRQRLGTVATVLQSRRGLPRFRFRTYPLPAYRSRIQLKIAVDLWAERRMYSRTGLFGTVTSDDTCTGIQTSVCDVLRSTSETVTRRPHSCCIIDETDHAVDELFLGSITTSARETVE